ncbi:D-alanyl-D-alanine carboxypeptidase/D-alanyl-D-alanine-endopeptidase [Shewanella eurypsychrophilus]|uniref:D-alanyl-D-alanine carboxypeptidase/D-alanyl-D-alanine-endopeptidase n=1 Tax=Shewanella eurypsychrophilus TaxID=2593656 RepID=A0ABX6V6A3_9GAMM|nr:MULTISPECIES: D-alanyl-D-alanine carboxypeptidase/D-alanyl-D-alanine-endopeptidase [Shewanella]QFU22877.1 D-alanyl-D-alanine carboxypeptidase/D-alanyl-D-alanine-endopeptidase [Shewanella sp. YLB-09]QPG58163.1 D-alanyl-D-alanine carboxypeptidase/D-alanyl-D-alanine-endopeptidase [Shewanella eurypsychrophilus]
MRFFVKTCILFVSLSSVAIGDEYFSNLLSIIKPPHSHTAIIVTNLVTGEVIFEQNPETLLLPASTMKLLTAVAATSALGNDFKFSTQVFSHFPIRNGVIPGDVYIQFSGDPTLTTLDLRALFKQLSLQGLSQIKGNVYLIGQENEQLQAPGWVWDDLGICYAAPVSSFVINRNCIHGQLKPKLASNKSQLTLASYLPVVIDNTAIFDKTGKSDFCELDLKRFAKNQFSLSGCYAGTQAIKLAIAITDPALFTKDSVTQILKTSLIKLDGQVQITHQQPVYTSLIASHQSHSLPELIKVMLLKSDNLIADSLVKQLGQITFNLPGNFTNGSLALKRILTHEGIELTHAKIVDGSGLSRYNLLSASQLSQVLSLIYTDERFSRLFASLPVAGVSGTLKYKHAFNKPPLREHILAKTGSMQGVDNLAGFISRDDDDDLLFVILENGQSAVEKKNQLAPFSALFLQSLMDHPSKQENILSSSTASPSQAK